MKRFSKLLVALLALVVVATSCNKESSEKKILSFSFVTPAVEAVVTESAKTIVAVVPFGTDVTALVPVITISDKATISPASGIPTNFTNPVTYTVMAEDGSQAMYTVTVTVDNNGGGGGGGGGSTDPTQIYGSIDANTTWPDLGLPVDYVVDGWLWIDGNALLTIEPGVTIMFTGADGGMEIGENAGLKMVGTAEKPIVFCGPANNPNNGSWNRIVLNSKRNDNQWEYVQFLRGGSDDYKWSGVVDIQNGKVSMKNCLIDGSLGVGIDTEYGDTRFIAFENNVIKNCASYPWITENIPALFTNVSTNNVFEANGKNHIEVTPSYYELEESVSFKGMPIPYHFEDGIEFGGNKTLTLEPGVEFMFDYDFWMIVSEEVIFKAVGTPQQPIVFRGTTSEDLWRGLEFKCNRSGSKLDFVNISNTGADPDDYYKRSALYLRGNSQCDITNCTFSGKAYGVAIEYINDYVGGEHSGNVYDAPLGNVYNESDGTYNGVEYYAGQILNDLP